MPFPYFIRKLFQNNGAGDLLNKGIIPPSYVDTAAQTFTDKQKAQARANIGAIDKTATVAKAECLYSDTYLGNFNGETVAQLASKLYDWVFSLDQNPGHTCNFIASANWVSLWNNNDNSTTISDGNKWLVTCIAATQSAAKCCGLLVTDYVDGAVFHLTYVSGAWTACRPFMLSKQSDFPATPVRYLKEFWTQKNSTSGIQWYKKYSDGWIEQGDSTPLSSWLTEPTKTITLFTPFANDTYFIAGPGFVVGSVKGARIDSTTKTSFTIKGDDVGQCYWYACGY